MRQEYSTAVMQWDRAESAMKTDTILYEERAALRTLKV
jgi:hypothetical protein